MGPTILSVSLAPQLVNFTVLGYSLRRQAHHQQPTGCSYGQGRTLRAEEKGLHGLDHMTVIIFPKLGLRPGQWGRRVQSPAPVVILELTS